MRIVIKPSLILLSNKSNSLLRLNSLKRKMNKKVKSKIRINMTLMKKKRIIKCRN